jgi:deoxyribose-phosphate aldolase
VCIPPCYVKLADGTLRNSDIKVITVIGFPLGNTTCKAKAMEVDQAFLLGADEVDVVWNIGHFLNNEYLRVVEELSWLVDRSPRDSVKVIVEECYLNIDQLRVAWNVVRDSGAFAIKTSTGTSKSGATIGAIELWKSMGDDLKIKAAGGIITLFDATEFIRAGADIIGSSYSVSISEENKQWRFS